MRRSSFVIVFVVIAWFVSVVNVGQAAADTLRVAALKFGTVNWVLDTIVKRKLDEKYKFSLKVIPLASTNGSKIALQGGSADISVADWIWVSRRRAEKALFTMVPYSSSVGDLMVAKDGPIKSLEDLRGKTIGVAGGPLDKSWLFFRAYYKQKIGVDVAEVVTPVFGAAPLLTQKMIRGEFDGVLNFSHYSARLKAKGFRSLVSVGDMMTSLGTSGPTVSIGFVFSEAWASKNEDKVRSFLKAVKEALSLLDKDETIWQEIRPRMKAEDERTFEALKTTFKKGILRRPLVVEQADVGRLYKVLVEIGGPELVGRSRVLSAGTFWLTGDVSLPVPLEEGE